MGDVGELKRHGRNGVHLPNPCRYVYMYIDMVRQTGVVIEGRMVDKAESSR